MSISYKVLRIDIKTYKLIFERIHNLWKLLFFLSIPYVLYFILGYESLIFYSLTDGEDTCISSTEHELVPQAGDRGGKGQGMV